jgi:hypothetical protein
VFLIRNSTKQKQSDRGGAEHERIKQQHNPTSGEDC